MPASEASLPSRRNRSVNTESSQRHEPHPRRPRAARYAPCGADWRRSPRGRTVSLRSHGGAGREQQRVSVGRWPRGVWPVRGDVAGYLDGVCLLRVPVRRTGECYAELENVGKRARRSGRTVRRHVPALMARGLVQCSARQGGHTPSRWSVVLPADVRAGRTSVSPSVRGGQDVRAGRDRMSGQGGQSVRRYKR